MKLSNETPPPSHSVVVLLNVNVFACLAVGKMATDWQGLALHQAELISSRVREVLSLGVKFLKTELGIELDLKPELYPSWIILSTVFIGLFVVAVLTWVAACSVGRKRRPIVSDSSDVVKASVTKTIKTEEPKKRNKKKSSDKVCAKLWTPMARRNCLCLSNKQ